MKKIAHVFVSFLFAYRPLLGTEQKLSVIQGELWVNHRDHSSKPISATNGKIDGYTISSSSRYAAAHKIISETVDPDDTLPEDKQPMAPTYSVLIFDLKTERLVQEITAPPEFFDGKKWTSGLLHLGKWSDNDIYQFTTGSMLDVTGHYEYDPQSDQLWEMKFDDNTGMFKRGNLTNHSTGRAHGARR